MKYKILPFLALLTFFFIACDKDDEISKDARKGVLMGQDWQYDDIQVVQDFTVKYIGQVVIALDTAFSPLDNIQPCERDFTVQFLADEKVAYTLLDSYCGDDLGDAKDIRWTLSQDNTKFTLHGLDVAGVVSVDGVGEQSLGDEAVYTVIELTEDRFIYEYDIMEESGLLGMMGMEEFEDLPGLEIDGIMTMRITMSSR